MEKYKSLTQLNNSDTAHKKGPLRPGHDNLVFLVQLVGCNFQLLFPMLTSSSRPPRRQAVIIYC